MKKTDFFLKRETKKHLIFLLTDYCKCSLNYVPKYSNTIIKNSKNHTDFRFLKNSKNKIMPLIFYFWIWTFFYVNREIFQTVSPMGFLTDVFCRNYIDFWFFQKFWGLLPQFFFFGFEYFFTWTEKYFKQSLQWDFYWILFAAVIILILD